MASLRRLRVALILLTFLALPGASWAADAFAVRGIDVDVTAAAVAVAKEQALTEAQRTGFRRLLERLTMPADHGRLPAADPLPYVRDVAIEQERSSAVRYIAILTVRYNAVAVKKLLRDAGLKYAEQRPRPVVIVPLLKPQGGGRPLLWDDPNPWRAAWLVQGTGALVPLALPTGDTADIAALTVEKALVHDAEGLGALAARFRTADVLVATASVNAAGTALEVSLGGTPGVLKPFDAKSFPLTDAGLDAAMRTAAADIAQGLDAVYKQGNLLSFDRAATMAAMVQLRGLDDWLAVRERLGRVPLVRRWEIVSLSREEAALVLHTVGEPEQVKATLAAAGLAMEWSDGFWTMRPVERK
ncbi:MAG: DUF2066 domain-containing protein [Magnetospirillum sp.]|nr:MAG: DUF2066 domain-containing protein [Magnetospirillum sp.]